MTDAVEKRFCATERARLIQDQAPMRNVDSKIHSLGFDCFKFRFYRFFADTFSTASTHSGLSRPNIDALQEGHGHLTARHCY